MTASKHLWFLLDTHRICWASVKLRGTPFSTDKTISDRLQSVTYYTFDMSDCLGSCGGGEWQRWATLLLKSSKRIFVPFLVSILASACPSQAITPFSWYRCFLTSDSSDTLYLCTSRGRARIHTHTRINIYGLVYMIDTWVTIGRPLTS